VLEGSTAARPAVPLQRDSDGYFSGLVADAQVGSRYRFQLDDESELAIDPASRFQPEGPHGASQIIDPNAFHWHDAQWKGVSLADAVIYEMHIGTFTSQGTWAAAQEQLHELAELGITVIEVMPLADFAGRFGWGYDGVNLFAPTRLYGCPDDVRRFVDVAHRLGMAVILDVVYNHLGPDGNPLERFCREYFTDRYKTDWGAAINFDGPNSAPVRDFFRANAAYWIREFHFDGLRLDATQNIYDESETHILAEISAAVRDVGAGKATLLIAENEPQETRLVRPAAAGGYGLDALWNDDLHHTALVALTGRNEAYYSDYRGTPQEFVSAVKWGYLYQGQWYRWQQKRRGTPAFDLDPSRFVVFLENHDQVANSARGLRCHALSSPGRYRALTGLILLSHGTPMLFQGQEFASSAPFYFFADHREELAELVHQGRCEFLRQFPSAATEEAQHLIRDPADPQTFEACKLDFAERERHAGIYRMHRDLLRLRRIDPAFLNPRPRGIDGAVLGDEAFVLRYFVEGGQDRILVVNLGRDLHLDPAPEPLLAPPAHCIWEILWSSENPQYGGCGTPALDTEENWQLPGNAAVLLRPRREPPAAGPASHEGDGNG
jgi:maltooligosyltrehalose trehalohydrolase